MDKDALIKELTAALQHTVDRLEAWKRRDEAGRPAPTVEAAIEFGKHVLAKADEVRKAGTP